MNWQLLKWYAALLGLTSGLFILVIGSGLLALFLFGIIELSLGIVGITIISIGIALLYVSYRWFTAGVSENNKEEKKEKNTNE